MLVRELLVAYASHRSELPRKLQTPKDAAEHILELIGSEVVEVVIALFLDAKHQLICWHELSRGTVDRSIVHPREVFAAAFTARATGIVLGHNHPSGDPTPSAEDTALTKRLCQVGQIVGIDLLDHIIVAERGYCSLRESGAL